MKTDLKVWSERLRIRFICVTVVLLCPTLLWAQGSFYVGALGGLATLSGDGRSVITSSSAATSLYDPKNGGAASLFWGFHVWKYVSLQGNYIWNRNSLTLVSSLSTPAGVSFYQQPISSTENALIVDALVYFRPRGDRIRPYLSQGGGLVHVSSGANGSAILSGSGLAPPGHASSTFPGSRTAVGLDVRVARALYFRYTFGENISHNPVSALLSPPGQRLLKNFQNLFGVYRTF
jgi:hypothetical protein